MKKSASIVLLAALAMAGCGEDLAPGTEPMAGPGVTGEGVAFVYVGGVPLPMTTTPRDITIFRLDVATGKLTAAGSAAGATKPSFLAFQARGKFLYAIDEVETGKVVAYSIDQATGALTLLNSASAAGFGPAHISLDRTGKWALTASWADKMPASIGVIPIQPDGRVGEPVDRKDFIPMGYAHYITTSPDNRFVLANLNGEQAVAQYRFDAATGKLTANDPPRATFPPNYGPRHLDFHPNGKFVYVIHEQGGKITVHGYDSARGTLTQLQDVPTLPEGFTGANTTAHVLVHRSGKFLYGSNRGHDSLAIYRVDEATGMLAFVAHQTGVGARPRNFAIDPSGTRLLVASQDEHNLRVYKIDQTTGMLQALGGPQPVGNRPSWVGTLLLPGR